VFVQIDPKNPGQSPRRVIWGEERFKAVQALHEGEGHYGGIKKTRLKVADRYWFSQLSKFVNIFVKTCNVCQKERAGAAPRDDREIFPTPPTAPWFCTHVDFCGPFEETGPQKYRYIAVAVDSVTKFVEMRPLKGSKLKGVDSEAVADFLRTEILHRYPGVYEVVTDRGGEFGAKFTLLCKAWGIKHVQIAAKKPKANGQVERYMQVIKPALRKCAHEHPGEWHKHVSGVACDLRAANQDTIKMSPTMALFGREAILPIEKEIPTLSTLKQPNLDQEETKQQRKERFTTMEHMQSLCKAHIKQTQFVQMMNYSTWSLKRRSRADVLKKNDWVLMKRPGNIRGARLRWEGPYIFQGYKYPEIKRKAVLEDGKGKRWYRASNQIRRYYPRMYFTKEYLELMKRIDAQVPTGREIEQRFVEQVCQAPSFVTLRIAEKLMRIRKTVGFDPADKPLRFNI
jgi:hypothetical protein